MSNQQDEVPIRVRPLQRQLERALTRLPRPLPAELTEISIVLVDRATMRRVHADFLDDPTETDVITFPYGEIIVCPAVARDQAPRFGRKIPEEVLLYGLHGLLHLVGFDDVTSVKAKRMAQEQEKLLGRVMRDGI